MNFCRACGQSELSHVLDLGEVPAADFFPPAADPVAPGEASHPLAMAMCGSCGLAQLADDDTITEEPRGVEPQALKDQAEVAIKQVAADGCLRGDTVLEFGSPHGGTWLPLLIERGYCAVSDQADVVLDTFGLMHEPDQRSAFARRAQVTSPAGVLLIQYHSMAAIVGQGQWNALRHGHFAYYSLTALARLLGDVGMRIRRLWEYDLYGGTVMLAAVHGPTAPDDSVQRILAMEDELGITTPAAVNTLQHCADRHVASLRSWLGQEAQAGHTVFAYGAASRAVALFSRARIDSRHLSAVADASPAKQGRRMPGTDIPIVSPHEMLAAKPDRVLLTLPDLLSEVSTRFPELQGRWKVDWQ
jgi:hypothetical protein